MYQIYTSYPEHDQQDLLCICWDQSLPEQHKVLNFMLLSVFFTSIGYMKYGPVITNSCIYLNLWLEFHQLIFTLIYLIYIKFNQLSKSPYIQKVIARNSFPSSTIAIAICCGLWFSKKKCCGLCIY